MTKITGIQAKVDLNVKVGVANANKVEASDINEIVSVVNANDTLLSNEITNRTIADNTLQSNIDTANININNNTMLIDSLVDGNGKTFTSIALAMAELPLPSDNTAFTVRDSVDNLEDGYYIYLSNEVGGYKFLTSIQSIANGYNLVVNLNDFNSLITNSTEGIWLIISDITLDGNKTLPQNVTLKFRNSKINLGGFNLVGNNTKIDAGLEQIFDTNGNLTGSWDIEKFIVSWVGAKGDNLTDNVNAIDFSFDFISSYGGTLYFPAGVYIDSGGDRYIQGSTGSSPFIKQGLQYGYFILTGELNTTIRCTQTSGTWLKTSDGNQQQLVTIKNLSFEGGGQLSTSVWLDNVGEFTGGIIFENISVGKFGTAFIGHDLTAVTFDGYNQFIENGLGLACGFKSDFWTGTLGLSKNLVGMEIGYIDVRHYPDSKATYTQSLKIIATQNDIGIIVGGNGTNGISLNNCYIENSVNIGVQIGNGTETNFVRSVDINGCYIAGNTPKPISILKNIIDLKIQTTFFETTATEEIYLENTDADNSMIFVDNGNSTTKIKKSDATILTIKGAISYGRSKVDFQSNDYSTNKTYNGFMRDMIVKGSTNINPFRAGRANSNDGVFTAGWQVKRNSYNVDILEGVESYLKPSTFNSLPSAEAKYFGMIAVLNGVGSYTCVISPSGNYEWKPCYVNENLNVNYVKYNSSGSVNNQILSSSALANLTYWTQQAEITVTDNQVSGFYGINTIAKIDQTSTGTSKGVESVNFPIGGAEGVLSCIVESGTSNNIYIRLMNATTFVSPLQTNFDTSSGAFSSSTGVWSAELISTGKYRISASFTGLTPSDNYRVKISPNQNGGSAVGFAYAGDVQVDLGTSVVREYVETNGAIVSTDALVLDIRNSSNVQKGFIRGDGSSNFETLRLNNIIEYTDNADAISNGLGVGDFYRTGDNLKIVH